MPGYHGATSKPASPFAWVAGTPYLVVSFDLDPSREPSHHEILHHLLDHHPAGEILILRPLSPKEVEVLEQSVVERENEAWALMVVRDEDRYRGQ